MDFINNDAVGIIILLYYIDTVILWLDNMPLRAVIVLRGATSRSNIATSRSTLATNCYEYAYRVTKSYNIFISNKSPGSRQK